MRRVEQAWSIAKPSDTTSCSATQYTGTIAFSSARISRNPWSTPPPFVFSSNRMALGFNFFACSSQHTASRTLSVSTVALKTYEGTQYRPPPQSGTGFGISACVGESSGFMVMSGRSIAGVSSGVGGGGSIPQSIGFPACPQLANNKITATGRVARFINFIQARSFRL
jgi:hypothetical protein